MQTNKAPKPPGGTSVQAIMESQYSAFRTELKHVFLAGNLQRPAPHPFFRREDVEIIATFYEAGDDSRPHWHNVVDEIEVVVEGHVKIHDITNDKWATFGPGDVHSVPHGVCVKRVIEGATRTIAVKLPSNPEKVHCPDCQRECRFRVERYKQL